MFIWFVQVPLVALSSFCRIIRFLLSFLLLSVTSGLHHVHHFLMNASKQPNLYIYIYMCVCVCVYVCGLVLLQNAVYIYIYIYICSKCKYMCVRSKSIYNYIYSWSKHEHAYAYINFLVQKDESLRRSRYRAGLRQCSKWVRTPVVLLRYLWDKYSSVS